MKFYTDFERVTIKEMNKILKLARKKNTYTFVFYQSKEEHIQKRGIIAIEREKNSYILLTIL